MIEFVKTLRHWYLASRRDLPWRNTRDPYFIWLSEVILQQTRVNQGLPYYLKFIEAYPTLADLGNASEDEVLHLWQGLGYYSRARNMQTAARQIMTEHDGIFPTTYLKIRSLKGIGDYTAAAIASFAFELPHAVVDGNVYRFLSRLTGSSTPIDTTAGKKEFGVLADELLDLKKPGLHNQAMMEIGATVCLPSKPLCHECPFAGGCAALRDGTISALPIKSKKTAVRKRYFHYFLFQENKNTFIYKRKGKDIWSGLYEFPLLETEHSELPENHPFLSTVIRSKEYRHLLSHQQLFARFYIVTGQAPEAFPKLIQVAIEDLHAFAMPQLLVKFLKEDPISPVLKATAIN